MVTGPEYRISQRGDTFYVIRRVGGIEYVCCSFTRRSARDARDAATKHAVWHNQQSGQK